MTIQKMVTLDQVMQTKSEHIMGGVLLSELEVHAVPAIPVADMREAWLCPAEGTYGSRSCGCPEARRVLIADHPE